MNLRYFKNILPVAAFAIVAGLSSCTKDLDVTPIDPNTNMTVDEPALYSKCYANMALAGNTGANGDCDINGLDGGTTGFVRQLFNANELTTDESICGWGDTGIPAFDYNQWDSSHPMLQGLYYRLYTGIAYCNHYLDVCNGVDPTRTAEVRFLRCLYYYYLMDCFGNVPFTTQISSSSPEQIHRADLFNWIEAELLGKAISFQTYSKGNASATVTRGEGDAIIDGLQAPVARTSKSAGYGRVDQDGANLLLARMYLNEKVYKDESDFSQTALQNAETYAKKVIDGPHKLWGTTDAPSTNADWSAYQMLFMGDNGESGASVEAILPLLQDGVTTTSWGTSLFLMAACWKSDMDEDANYGTTEFWSGNRARSQFIAKFFPNGDAPNVGIEKMKRAANDNRALFFGTDRELIVTNPSEFTSGYSVGKFRNTYSDGGTPHSSQFVDCDYFFMRSAEAYLIYAECNARLNGGSLKSGDLGKDYIDKLRGRAYAPTRAQYSLQDVLDERCRELYYEGFRRTDLIRAGQFASNSYLWDWKGGAQTGVSFDSRRCIFAIPAEDMNANPNLVQNPGY